MAGRPMTCPLSRVSSEPIEASGQDKATRLNQSFEVTLELPFTVVNGPATAPPLFCGALLCGHVRRPVLTGSRSLMIH